MLLAINANNTNVKFGLYHGDRLRGDWRIRSVPGRTADEYIVWLSHLLAMQEIAPVQITGAIIASVVPEAVFHLERLCRLHLSVVPLIVGKAEAGIEIRIDKPAELGADRIANAVGGYLLFRRALIVVDFGTATTFDVIDDRGNYMGGAIAPGINLSLRAMHEATAKLPHIAPERPARAIGTDTLSAMQSGIFWGYVGLIEGLVERIRSEWGSRIMTVATGGLAPLFFGQTEALDHHEPDITMIGLREIFQRNRGSHETRL
ncbi:MAG TPA: type III pantothenate kinase [Dongiaceae bacterium]|jgi:type III pantothenate kinase|nr:type III pantothenate kinase [Dongiaceae bacterium]